MRLDEIQKIDIKLLVAFTAIMEEGSVSRAADRLNVTQPALSKSLQRLRSLFNDALFSRQAYGLSPTSRGHELYDQIRPILSSLTELMMPATLDLKKIDRLFRLAVNESELESFIEPLLAMLHYEAPNIRLSISSWGPNTNDEILANHIDIGISPLCSTPGNIRSKLVGYVENCLILSEAHPLYYKDELSLQEVLDHRVITHHMKVSNTSYFSNTLQKLQQMGYSMEPTLQTDSLLVTIQAVKRGMALVASRQIGDFFQEIMNHKQGYHPIKILPIPKEIRDISPYENRHPIEICWHERDNSDVSHRWLREKIIEFMRESPQMHQT
jgi:DNA-binding transcriptional LysR family regulator